MQALVCLCARRAGTFFLVDAAVKSHLNAAHLPDISRQSLVHLQTDITALLPVQEPLFCSAL